MQDLRITNKLTSRKIIWVKRVKGLKKKKLKDMLENIGTLLICPQKTAVLKLSKD